jgi:hypothetical protein
LHIDGKARYSIISQEVEEMNTNAYGYSGDNWNQDSSNLSQDDTYYSESYSHTDNQYGHGVNGGDEPLSSSGYSSQSYYDSASNSNDGANGYNGYNTDDSYDSDSGSYYENDRSTSQAGVVINYYDNHIEYNDMHDPHIGNICCGDVQGNPGTIQT